MKFANVCEADSRSVYYREIHPWTLSTSRRSPRHSAFFSLYSARTFHHASVAKPCITHEQSLRTKILTIHFQANIDFSLCCTFQRLAFSERREILPTDRQIQDTQHDYCMPRGSAHRGIMTDNAMHRHPVRKPCPSI